MKNYNRNLKEFIILAAIAIMMLLPITINAQTRTDGFFGNSGNETYNDRGTAYSSEGLNAYNQQFGEHMDAPLGSGLLIMVVAGAGYALLKKKED